MDQIEEKLRSCCPKHNAYIPGCLKCKEYRQKYEKNRRLKKREQHVNVLTYSGIKTPRDRSYDNEPSKAKKPIHEINPGERCSCPECWDKMKQIGEKLK